MDVYRPDETNDKAVTRIRLAWYSHCMLGSLCADKVPLIIKTQCRGLVAGAAFHGETQPMQSRAGAVSVIQECLLHYPGVQGKAKADAQGVTSLPAPCPWGKATI